MTIKEAIEILEERVRIDKEEIGRENPMSDFDKFIEEQDEAMEIAIACLHVCDLMVRRANDKAKKE